MSDTGFDWASLRDLGAEQAVLGGMLLASSLKEQVIADVAEVVSPDDFHEPHHETIFNVIILLAVNGRSVDPITVADELGKRGELGKVGGNGYLHSLMQTAPTAANAAYYAEIVRDKAKLRRLAQSGVRIASMACKGEGDTDEILDAAQAEFNTAVTTREDGEAAPIGDGFEDYLDRLEAVQRDGHAKGVPTGFTDLDSLTGGLKPGQMVIVAARPGMGKSALAMDLARACAIKHQRPAMFFSLEMSRDELNDRLMSAQARVGLHRITNEGGMTEDDWDRFRKTTPRVMSAPLVIDCSTEQTVTRIKSRCRRQQQRGGLDLVVIDYLQLLKSGPSRAENRQVQVSEMSRDIKLMAKDLGVPVVVLAQLNRGPEQRTDKKPVASDLRESGALEQDADLVILLHREDAYEKESPRAGEADLIVAKHRNGPTATITVAFQGHYSRFVDMAQS